MGGTHLVLFGLHYWNKGISCAQPYVGFGIRRIKGIVDMTSCVEYYVYIFLLNGAKQLRTHMATNCRTLSEIFAISVLAQL
jgi:hypothetical protein